MVKRDEHTHARGLYLLYKTLARNELRFQKQNTKKKIEESIKHERYIKVQLSVFFYSANSECLHIFKTIWSSCLRSRSTYKIKISGLGNREVGGVVRAGWISDI